MTEVAVRQLYPPLDAATEAALRASIERFGVILPVVVDQHGEMLDGHHRVRIAGELGVEYETHVREVADAAEALAIVRTLNEDRRMLSPEQRRAVVVALRSEGHSQRAIAAALGVKRRTVRTDLDQVGAARPPGSRITGRDGKSYAAAKPRSTARSRRRHAEAIRKATVLSPNAQAICPTCGGSGLVPANGR